MRITAEDGLSRDEALELYGAVGWHGYVNDPDALLRGLAGAHVLLTARDDDGRLAGLARTVSDDATVCYVQDLLIHPDMQRRGVGRLLMEELKRRYAHCRFFVLSTDAAGTEDAQRSHPFYRAQGLIEHAEQGMTAFALPVRRGPAPD
ncbi:GNAT family N-acetyltransferase [Actinoplanes sp. NBRC 101535]|uniref:GNAT family N-acetyltransferase n=1 Tax=Actinoplanes sp. NBRC 101535 TaxID=3032196 RepID=UPI0024A22D6F|nr:GNAT family N-acetyltransferase [Actinoplanes sp. NBRC 101535]GLY00456.1 N-acetyltransferase [Actinoplanes sp. NBRC 101535]